MDMQEYLHMNHGEGEFSYAHNSSAVPGNLFTQTVKPAVRDAIRYQLLHNITKHHKTLKVADLGCGVGPTPVAFIATVVETMHTVWKDKLCENNDQVSEVQIYMSDLPSTDFNMLFKDAAKLLGQMKDVVPKSFVMGAPGSFYGRLFPAQSLHFVHSCAALHWISEIPRGLYNEEGVAIIKGSIFASETSTPKVRELYYAQFKNDFTSFLTCRSEEVVANGQVLISLAGRDSIKPSQHLLASHQFQALTNLVSEGVITQEKLDSYNLPAYFPCTEEIEEIVSEEGSFEIENTTVTVDRAASNIKDTKLRSEAIAKFIRSIVEAIVSHHFGAQIWGDLQIALQKVILKYLNSNNDAYDITHFTFLLKKKLN